MTNEDMKKAKAEMERRFRATSGKVTTDIQAVIWHHHAYGGKVEKDQAAVAWLQAVAQFLDDAPVEMSRDFLAVLDKHAAEFANNPMLLMTLFREAWESLLHSLDREAEFERSLKRHEGRSTWGT